MVSNEQLQTIFLNSASEVFETMCFVGVMGENALPPQDDLVAADLFFTGNPSGRFGIQMPASAGRMTASNFLGKDAEEVTDAEIEQVVGELANMICGSVLSRAEAEARFELHHPVISHKGIDLDHPGLIHSAFELEEGYVVLWMEILQTEQVPSAA